MEIQHTERRSQEKWLNLFVRHFEHNGKSGQWIFASRSEQPATPPGQVNAVVIVPLVLDEHEPPRLVVTREFRVPLGAFEYAFPAGLVDEGESVEQAAARELEEETGLELLRVTRVSPPTFSSSGMTDEAVVIAFVEARKPPNCEPKLQDSEIIETLFLDYEQVCELCHAPIVVNGRAWPILHMYERLGKLC